MAEERRRFLTHCAKQRMSQESLRSIACYTLIVANALRLSDRPSELIARSEIEAEGIRWVNRPQPPKVSRLLEKFRSHAIRWLSFLGRLEPPPTIQQPYADHVAQFTEYMLRERGLAVTTVWHRKRGLHKFLAQIDEAGLRLETLTIAQVDALLAEKIRVHGYSRVTVQIMVSYLRPFFRFGEGRGWCRPGLAAAIMAPHVYSHEGLPTGPSWDDVKRVFKAAEGNRPTDIRDRALLMLLAVYALRAGEVVSLRLEDFDWEKEVLTVPRGKRQWPRIYPLCRSVGDAVLRYLREVRPESTEWREVFLAVRAPFRPMKSDGLGEVVNRRFHALGVPLAHYGSHALRHACANHLLAQGLSLKEIGDHLGHQSPQTTRIYAKVDLAALRTVGDFNLEDLL